MCSILFNDDNFITGVLKSLRNFGQPNWPTLIRNCMYRIQSLVIKTRGWIIQSRSRTGRGIQVNLRFLQGLLQEKLQTFSLPSYTLACRQSINLVN